MTQVIDGVESEKSVAEKFTTLKIIEPKDIYFAHMTHQVQKGESFTPAPIVFPTETTSKDYKIEVVSGEEFVELKGNTIVTKEVGNVVLSASVVGFPDVKTKENLTIDIIDKKVPVQSIDMLLPSTNGLYYNNVDYNYSADYKPYNTTELGIIPSVYNKEDITFKDGKMTILKSGDHEVTFESKYNNSVKATAVFKSTAPVESISTPDLVFDLVGEKQEALLTYIPRESEDVYAKIELRPLVDGIVKIEKVGKKFNVESLKDGTTDIEIFDTMIMNQHKKVGTFKVTVNTETK